MKQITHRLNIANNISEEQLARYSPNIVIILNSGAEGKLYELCNKLGFITRSHDIINLSEKELNGYVDSVKLMFGCGDKLLIISNDSATMKKYCSKLISCVTGMSDDDATQFVRNKA